MDPYRSPGDRREERPRARAAALCGRPGRQRPRVRSSLPTIVNVVRCLPDLVELDVIATPCTKGNSAQIARNPKTGSTFVVQSKQAKEAIRGFQAALRALGPGPMLEGKLRLDLWVVIPGDGVGFAGAGERFVAAGASGRRSSRKVGDRGNYLKLVEDCLEGWLFKNDDQVVSGEPVTVWGPVGGYRIHCRPAAQVACVDLQPGNGRPAPDTDLVDHGTGCAVCDTLGRTACECRARDGRGRRR